MAFSLYTSLLFALCLVLPITPLVAEPPAPCPVEVRWEVKGEGEENPLSNEFLSGFAATVLSEQAGEQGQRFVASAGKGAESLRIRITTSEFHEEITVERGQNITEYRQHCRIVASVWPPGRPDTEKPEVVEATDSTLKKREGTEVFQSPTITLDEVIEPGPLFSASFYGKTLALLFHRIATPQKES